jgi:probable HAF family extracellular repeat protein
VVGTLQQSPYGASSAFVWDRSSGLRALGNFEGRSTTGGGINDRGEVAGNGVGFVYDPGTAFRWSPAGGFELLGRASASGINNAREVSGTALGPAPLRWTAGGEQQSLGSLGGTQGIANAINDSGQIVGYSRNTLGYPRPFLWDPLTGMRDLGTFRGGAASVGVAYGINDRGHVVGNADSEYGRAFLWRNGQLTAVGPELSYAYAVNNLDHVVGEFSARAGLRAFLSRDGSFTDLNRLIPAGSGITLTGARAINDAGWIVANGRNRQGARRAFVLIPR